jgi:hypothetical protein
LSLYRPEFEVAFPRFARESKAMGGEAVHNCDSVADRVIGQIFVARGNEIFLMSQPRPVRGLAKLEGWTPETIGNHYRPAFEPMYADLGPTASVFNWEPV